MITDKSIDIYIDTVGIRCEYYGKYDRDNLFNKIINFIGGQHIVGIVFDNKNSTKYYQTTKLQYGNSTLATISKGFYEQTSKSGYRAEYYYINISFYGLMRYNKIKDDASRFLIRTIAAYLNTNNIDFKLTELDIAMDIKSKPDNILAICTKRTANVHYYDLGDYTIDNNKIQENDGTYYIEKFESHEQKKNAMSRAYLYDKRQKERNKFKREIGFDLTRFELKLQKRYFVKNEYGITEIYKKLLNYTVLYFEDLGHKEMFIKAYNDATTSRQRKKIVEKALSIRGITQLSPKMRKVGTYLREIDTVKFTARGKFKYVKRDEYTECLSKFNRKRYFFTSPLYDDRNI